MEILYEHGASKESAKYGFPYDKPYSVQVELMDSIYGFLRDENAKLGLFESPTGTVSTRPPRLFLLSICLTYFDL